MAHQEDKRDSFGGKDGGVEIADALSELFAEGGSLNRFSESDPLLVYERISETRDRRSIIIEQFVAQLDHFGIRNEILERAVDYIPRSLRNYRGITSSSLINRNASEMDVALVESLTLQDVALYANQQYRAFSNRLVTMSVGSSEHREALEKATFWSQMDERIGLAAANSSV